MTSWWNDILHVAKDEGNFVNFAARVCNDRGEKKVEMIIDISSQKFDRRAHTKTGYPVLTIAEATELRDRLSRCIEEAS